MDSTFFLFLHFFICLPLWKQISRDKWLGHSWLWRCCEPWRWEDYSCMSHLIQSLIQEMPGKHHLFNLLQTVTFLVCRAWRLNSGFSGLPRNEFGSVGMECLWAGSIFHLRKMSLMGKYSPIAVSFNLVMYKVSISKPRNSSRESRKAGWLGR